jgi:repressor LexA
VKDLTKKQERVLAFLQRRVRKTGKTPTYREIAAELRVDVRSAYQHVEALERKGFVERAGRHIELADDHRPERGIPVVGRVAAGAPILAIENVEEHVDFEREFDDDAFFLRVRGDSMTGAGINDGDLVLVHPQPRVDNGQIAAVIVGEEATVKRVFLRKGRVELHPENPAHRTMVYGPEDDVRIAGKVVMTMRRL